MCFHSISCKSLWGKLSQNGLKQQLLHHLSLGPGVTSFSWVAALLHWCQLGLQSAGCAIWLNYSRWLTSYAWQRKPGGTKWCTSTRPLYETWASCSTVVISKRRIPLQTKEAQAAKLAMDWTWTGLKLLYPINTALALPVAALTQGRSNESWWTKLGCFAALHNPLLGKEANDSKPLGPPGDTVIQSRVGRLNPNTLLFLIYCHTLQISSKPASIKKISCHSNQ